jgi:hypothetical protein
MDKDLPNKQIAEMSREELFELFDWYDFKDETGHPLTSCELFQELVEIAINKNCPSPSQTPIPAGRDLAEAAGEGGAIERVNT